MAPKLLIIPIIANYGSAHPQTGQFGLYKTRACFHSRRSHGCDNARRYLFRIDLRAKRAVPAIHRRRKGVSSCFAKRSRSQRDVTQSRLPTTSFVQNLMTTPANPAPFSQKTTEVVKISTYPTASGVTQFTRSPNGSVITNSVASALGTGLVKVDVSVSWTMTLGRRARIEQTSSIVSNGTKK